MNVLVSFESASLLTGLTRFEDRKTVNVAITLVFQWLLEATHQNLTPTDVIERVNQVITDTFGMAEYILTPNTQVDHASGQTTSIRYPLLHHEPGAKNYGLPEYNTSHNNWFHRYAEIVEHLVYYYAHQAMGFFRSLERDKHAVSVQHVAYTDRYITIVVVCRNLIEYKGPNHVP